MVLSPCPFCGGRAEYLGGIKVTGYVMCRKCEVMGPNLIESEAVEAWNRRAASAPPEALQKTHPNGLWMVYYEDADVKPEIFFGEGSEVAARARYAQANMSWSCHLLSRVPDASIPSPLARSQEET